MAANSVTQSPLDLFLRHCSDEITRRADLLPDDHVLRSGASAFAQALDHATPVDRASSTVPVAELLPDALPSPLLTAALAAGPETPWIMSPRMSDNGTEGALAPMNEVRDLGDTIVGLLALRPGGVYPLHSHPPQELYLPISDGGEWRYGGHETFRALPEDALAYNHPNDVHSIVAGATPLLALYVLWS